jgi:iron complex outermembrane recepter protein
MNMKGHTVQSERINFLLKMLCSTAALTLSPAAFAQSSAPGGSESRTGAPTASADALAESDTSGQIADIVVTAQRRAENLQRVPISVQVVTAPVMAQRNLQTLVDISSVTPSIHVAEGARSNSLYIRGTGSGESQSFDQSVGTFIDDVYHGRSKGSTATFLDLDHLEILKGPQTAYFGNNAIAGAFNIITKKPGKTVDGWVRALLSPTGGTNGGQYALEGAATVPLSDTFGIRVAGTLNGQRGWLEDVAQGGNKRPDQRNYAFRATARWQPTDQLDVTLKGEIGRNRTYGGFFGQNGNCPPSAPFVANGFCALNLSLGAPTGLKNNKYASNGGFTALHTKEGVLTASYDLGGATITSVNGVNSYRTDFQIDADGAPVDLLNVNGPERYRQFSQELRLSSATGNPLEYVAGLYYQNDKLNTLQQVNFFLLDGPLATSPISAFLPLAQSVTAQVKEDVYSAFGSLTWNVTDRLKLNGALRGSIVHKDFDWNLTYGTAGGPFVGFTELPAALVSFPSALGLGNVGTVALDRTDRALMPSARVQYYFQPQIMAYASFARGFKAGGFSVADLTAVPSNYGFDPEHVNAYEIGLKSELFNRSVLLNLALFRNDFSNLQVSIQGQNPQGAFINFVRNAAQSRSQGLEFEGQWVLNKIFRLSASGTYLDSKYRSYPDAGPTYAQQLAGQPTQDLSGRHTPFAPVWSGSVTGSATVPVLNGYELTGEVTGIFSSKYQTYSSLDPLSEQPGYGRLDARISFDAPNGRWGFDIIGKNLTSTVIRSYTVLQPATVGSLIQQKVQPSNIAFQARLKF